MILKLNKWSNQAMCWNGILHYAISGDIICFICFNYIMLMFLLLLPLGTAFLFVSTFILFLYLYF